MPIIYRVIDFIKSSGSNKHELNTREFFRLYFVSIFIALCIGAFSGYIASRFGIAAQDHEVYKFAINTPIYIAIFIAVIVGPFWEELAFRAHLVRSNKAMIYGVSAFILAIIESLFNPIKLLDNKIFALYSIDNIFFRLIVTGASILLVYAIIVIIWKYIYKKNKSAIDSYYDKKYKYIFWLSVIIFALMHMVNYPPTKYILFIAPILTLPQLWMSILLSYVRVNMGFLKGFYFHALYNSIIFIPSIISIKYIQPYAELNMALMPTSIMILSLIMTVYIVIAIYLILRSVGLEILTIKKYKSELK